jgi:hypothetical protein
MFLLPTACLRPLSVSRDAFLLFSFHKTLSDLDPSMSNELDSLKFRVLFKNLEHAASASAEAVLQSHTLVLLNLPSFNPI